MNDFNRIAWFYDALADLIFRGIILQSQTHFIHLIKPYNRILIIGGGSGKVLDTLDQLNQPIIIDFVEPSAAMMKKAKKRASGLVNLNVHFYQQKFEVFNSVSTYDWICCFYFLDLFRKEALIQNITHIYRLMTDQTFLLVSDFQIKPNEKGWQKGLSDIMHTFFRLTASLESRRLQDINALILNGGFERIEFCDFFDQFIFSATYKKNVLKNGNHS